MTRKLHPCARTHAALRREIQESSETNKALAARLGRNIKTIAKWRSRATPSDARKGPRPASTMLSATEEAVIVVFRKHTRFTLDVCLAHLKPRIPALTRSALHRCLERYGVSRVPPGLAETPPKFGLRGQSVHFTIEVCAMPGEAGDYLYAAINQTLFVFAKVMKGLSPYDAADFLEDLQKNAPAGVSSVITSDHEAFGHPAEQPWEPKFPQRIHPFIGFVTPRPGCRISVGAIASCYEEIQLCGLPVPVRDHSSGDMAVPPVHPQLARRRGPARGTGDYCVL